MERAFLCIFKLYVVQTNLYKKRVFRRDNQRSNRKKHYSTLPCYYCLRDECFMPDFPRRILGRNSNAIPRFRSNTPSHVVLSWFRKPIYAR